jgi:hypothetical protein
MFGMRTIDMDKSHIAAQELGALIGSESSIFNSHFSFTEEQMQM